MWYMIKLSIRNNNWEKKYIIHVVPDKNILNINDFSNKINDLIENHIITDLEFNNFILCVE